MDVSRRKPRHRDEQLSRTEIGKDALQEGVTAASHTVGEVTTIITRAVGDVARALGGFATEMFEIRDSVRRASRQAPDRQGGLDDTSGSAT